MRIGRLRAAEAAAVVDLWIASWRSTGLAAARAADPLAARARFERDRRRVWSRVLVARDAGTGEVLGFLALKEAEAELDQIFVAPAAQGRGIGRALLHRAKARMPGGFTLRMAAENHRAQRFYEREGLRVVGEDRHPELRHPVRFLAWRPG